ncbi:hypothetical protein T459_23382 [Capsicum annuum]|uniref:Uncharacterized protein n=1 Tax=Capsicum annuum TaxID=4072 RepID=A0A2G2YS58_CAPAN|nr:hypothetical protein T459_23382 [Capsicum annuum]
MALSASDLPAMYSLLTDSLSRELSVRKPAETALAQSENRPGFCSCLMIGSRVSEDGASNENISISSPNEVETAVEDE